MKFAELHLQEPLLRALEHEGYSTPTPIQAKTIPPALAGKDVLGVAQTGTGKTAAFSLPILDHLSQEKPVDKGRRPIRALVLTPTRELALQINESMEAYGRHTHLRCRVIFGGVGQQPQVEALKRGVDILVATPGRLLDLMNQGYVDLNHLTHFVLDEADRMLDMGFIHDVRKVIAKLPRKRQSLFFSATMPPAIVELSSQILIQPVRVEVTPASTTAQTIQQSVYFVDKGNKRHLLKDLLDDASIERVLVFTRTKHGADRVAKDLGKAHITAQAIHGNKSQNARQNALNNFKEGKTRVLVATDIAARGIDIDNLTHVINYELPNIAESYVHRIGRTGRAGASGVAIAFCDAEEKAYLKDIQKLIGLQIKVVDGHDYPLSAMPQDVQKAPAAAPKGNGQHRRKSNSNWRKRKPAGVPQGSR